MEFIFHQKPLILPTYVFKTAILIKKKYLNSFDDHIALKYRDQKYQQAVFILPHDIVILRTDAIWH